MKKKLSPEEIQRRHKLNMKILKYLGIPILIFLVLIFNIDSESDKKRKRESAEKDSINNLPYFQRPTSFKEATINDAFGGLYPPQWIQLEKTVKNQFKFPDETEVDSPKQYGISNLDSGFVWFSTEVHSKNAFGVKTTNILKAQYRIDKDGKLFYCYHYFVE